LQTIILVLAVGLFAAVSYSDIKSLRIPNSLVAAVAILGLTRLIAVGDLSAALYTIAASVVVLIVAFLLFWRGLLGGGDAKLMAAVTVLVGHQGLTSFLFLMGICGGLVSFAVIVIHQYFPLFRGPRFAVLVPRARITVPYGVAIAAAGSLTLILQISNLR
jgi:prepilin peptidase CpaA